MNLKRAWQSVCYYLHFDQMKRADYARRKGIYHYVGNNVRLPASLVPLHSDLISFHDNIEVASGVKFVVHDAIHGVLNFKYHGTKDNPEFPEKFDCIEVMDNVFIGSGTTVLGGVRIGPNAVIGANSLVNSDIPEGTVCAGSPARVIGPFDKLVEKRRSVEAFTTAEAAWKRFYNSHKEDDGDGKADQ